MCLNFFDNCKGRNAEILSQFLPEFAHLLKNLGKHGPNPFQASSKDGARLAKDFNDSGKIFLNQDPFGGSKCCFSIMDIMIGKGTVKNSREFFLQVGGFLGLPEYTGKSNLTKKDFEEREKALQKELALKAIEQEKQDKIEGAKNHDKNEELWEHSIPLFLNEKPNPQASEVWKYFRNRGLGELENVQQKNLSQLRYVSDMEYFDIVEGKSQKQGRFSCLLSRIRDENNATVNLHRTYLLNGQKAPVSCPKKITTADCRLQSTSRFIQIGAVTGGVIAISEGIETALSVYLSTGIGCYASVCANNLSKFILPEGAAAVAVFADKDKNECGEKNARKLVISTIQNSGRRQTGFVVLPKYTFSNGIENIDWNDVLRKYGKSQLPCANTIIGFAKFIKNNPHEKHTLIF